MKRIDITPRKRYQDIIREQGFIYHEQDHYYTETAAYVFSAAEIDRIEAATAELYDMCLQAVQHVIDHNLWQYMQLPEAFAPFIANSWREDACSLYARFDLAYDGRQLKMLELNADTPTGLLEASVVQWYWVQDFNGADQFNSLHEKLVAHFETCKPYLGKLWFTAAAEHVEDFITVSYLRDCAVQAGYDTGYIAVEEIGVNAEGRFTAGDEVLEHVFKLYPWEWMFAEDFGPNLLQHPINWIEPPYKSILSNKMLLPLLWKMFPGHPLLLPADTRPLQTGFVKKPIFSREGANTTIVSRGQILESTDGMYGREGYVFQEYVEIPTHKGYTPVLGSWIVGGAPAGLGVRESLSRITSNTAHFVPHYIAG